ncbi:MAG TPA: SAM-dependent chlorinase/fluorinase [Thermoflexia bacterium]|nr:SAM-dependent chlorinase/fluorinase [Thermoflexia bacterium]
MRVITLTTDFGTADGYVGVMKGVMLSIAPEARLVDLSHEIPPQDVRRAAFVLYTAVPFFPPDTVHLAVVDPGVGTDRRAIAVRTPQGFFVGPDNGLFTYVLAEVGEWRAVELRVSAYRLPQVSGTFHGRDIFAPAAAYLARGVPLDRLGPPVTDPVLLPVPRLEVGEGRLEGEVLHIDHFGNVVTSVGRLRWEGDGLALDAAFRRAAPPLRFAAADAVVEVGGEAIQGVRRTYGEVAVGERLALVGSTGFLEIAVRQGSAARALGVRPGDPITVRLR